MSGRTFTYQGGFDDFVRYLMPDLELENRQKSVGVADGILRELEEFINRFVVTAINDNGDITFDAAGTYTFQGDVVVGGDIQSDNWTSLAAGWKLFGATGDAEFNGDVSVTGDVIAQSGGRFLTGTSGEYVEIGDLTYLLQGQGSTIFHGVGVFASDALIGAILADDAGSGIGLYAIGSSTNVVVQSTYGDIYIGGTSLVSFLVNGTEKGSWDSTGLIIGTGDNGFGPVTGSYGSVQTVGSGTNTYTGINFNGRAVIMEKDPYLGLYNDIDNEWYILCIRNSLVQIYADGTARFRVDKGATYTYGTFHISDQGVGYGGSGAFNCHHYSFTDLYRKNNVALNGILLLRSDYAGTGANQHIFYNQGSAANRLGSWGVISDERLKDDIEPLGDPREDLLKIPVIKYRMTHYFNEKGEVLPADDPGPRLVGWGAQTVQRIKPGLVQEDAQSGQLTVKSSVFVPLLHRAWQLDHEHLQDIEARLQKAGI